MPRSEKPLLTGASLIEAIVPTGEMEGRQDLTDTDATSAVVSDVLFCLLALNTANKQKSW